MTKYEDLHGKLDIYQPYLEALLEAKKNRVNDDIRLLTASLTKDQFQQDFFMDDSKSRAVDFKAPLREKIKIEKRSLDDFLLNNPIDSVLTEATEQELDSIIRVVKPINYVGTNEGLYNDITDLRITRDDMEKTIKTRDTEKMKVYTSFFYDNYLNNPINNATDEEKRITRAVINASPNFVAEFYIKRNELVSQALAVKLDGNKPRYIAAMMQNRNFIQFMVDYRALRQKEAEREDPYI